MIARRRGDATAGLPFSHRERLGSVRVTCPALSQGRTPMTIVGPLSVVAAYASLILVGAIVLGMF